MAVCENGGICIDGINNYTCSCPAPFTGATCTEMIESTMLPMPTQTFLEEITELPEHTTEKEVVEVTMPEKSPVTDVVEVTTPEEKLITDVVELTKQDTDFADKDFTTIKMEVGQETSISTLASVSTDLGMTEPSLEMTTLERVSIAQERIPSHVDFTAATITTNFTSDSSEPEMSAFFSPTPKSIFTTIAEQLGFSSISIGTEKDIETSVTSKAISTESDFNRYNFCIFKIFKKYLNFLTFHVISRCQNLNI